MILVKNNQFFALNKGSFIPIEHPDIEHPGNDDQIFVDDRSIKFKIEFLSTVSKLDALKILYMENRKRDKQTSKVFLEKQANALFISSLKKTHSSDKPSYWGLSNLCPIEYIICRLCAHIFPAAKNGWWMFVVKQDESSVRIVAGFGRAVAMSRIIRALHNKENIELEILRSLQYLKRIRKVDRLNVVTNYNFLKYLKENINIVHFDQDKMSMEFAGKLCDIDELIMSFAKRHDVFTPYFFRKFYISLPALKKLYVSIAFFALLPVLQCIGLALYRYEFKNVLIKSEQALHRFSYFADVSIPLSNYERFFKLLDSMRHPLKECKSLQRDKLKNYEIKELTWTPGNIKFRVLTRNLPHESGLHSENIQVYPEINKSEISKTEKMVDIKL